MNYRSVMLKIIYSFYTCFNSISNLYVVIRLNDWVLILRKFYAGRPGLVVTRGKLSQWLYWEKNLLERRTGHILDVFVNANSFCVQCSVMASAALNRDRVLHHLPRQVKFYSLSFHEIDTKRLFQRNKLLDYLERCPFTKYVAQSTT